MPGNIFFYAISRTHVDIRRNLTEPQVPKHMSLSAVEQITVLVSVRPESMLVGRYYRSLGLLGRTYHNPDVSSNLGIVLEELLQLQLPKALHLCRQISHYLDQTFSAAFRYFSFL